MACMRFSWDGIDATATRGTIASTQASATTKTGIRARLIAIFAFPRISRSLRDVRSPLNAFVQRAAVSRLCSPISLGISANAAAQTPPPDPHPPAAAPAGPSPSFQYGVRFGPSFTTLTSVEAFDDTAERAAFEPTMNFGGFFNFD